MKKYGFLALVLLISVAFVFVGLKIVGAQTQQPKIAYIDEDKLLIEMVPLQA